MANKKEKVKDASQTRLDFNRETRQSKSVDKVDKVKSPSKGNIVGKTATEGDLTEVIPKIVIRDTDATPNGSEDDILNTTSDNEENTEQQKEKDLAYDRSRHTPFSPAFTKKPDQNEDPFEEGEQIDPLKITMKELLMYKILPFTKEEELPNFVRSTNALQSYRVLRDLLVDWTCCRHHQKTLIDSALSDITPPGLRVTKQLEVIGSTPKLRLQALQIFSDAENKLSKVILDHYKMAIPKLEAEFREIYENMEKLNKEELNLMAMKMIRHKNEWINQQKDKREKKINKAVDSKNGEATTSTESAPKNPRFPWDQKPQRNRSRGRGKGLNTLNIA